MTIYKDAFPDELIMSLKPFIDSEAGVEWENQVVVNILSQCNPLKYEDLQRLSGISDNLLKVSIRELKNGLMVESYFKDTLSEDNIFYDLTLYGKKLHAGLMSPFIILGGKQ